jgi:hypothetical protein
MLNLGLIKILETPTTDYKAIGSIDDDFKHLKYEYRKLIENHYKVTYHVSKKHIYVVRIFDTRQHPRKNN